MCSDINILVWKNLVKMISDGKDKLNTLFKVSASNENRASTIKQLMDMIKNIFQFY